MTDTLRTLTVGRFTVAVVVESEEWSDHSWLGRYCNLRDVKPYEYVYDRASDAVRVPGSDLWRDRWGRIVNAGAELWHDRRSYRYIANDNGYDRIGHMFADADRLRGLEQGDWQFVILGAVVTMDNGAHWALPNVIGRAYLGGIESDSGDAYFRSEGRNLIHEAIADARMTRAALA